MFETVTEFEKVISKFYGAPYGVATDSCTHAIELCLRLKNIKSTQCPSHTYLSIPMTLTKLSIEFSWKSEQWKDFYFLDNTNIVDAAVLWKQDSYIKNSLMCLSFQFKKHLSLGRGGMILTDNYQDYQTLIKMSYDGRTRGLPWCDQPIDELGYHYYMTPETAQLGLEKFNYVKDVPAREWSYLDYPDLESKLSFLTNGKNL